MNFDKSTLRKVVYAHMNAKAYEVELFKKLLAEIDGRNTEAEETEEVEAPKKKAPAKTAEAPKKKAPAKEVEEDEVEAEESDDLGDLDDEGDNEPTLDDVRDIVKKFAKKHGKEKALKLLGKFKVTSIPDIKKADYSKVIELASKHL